MLRIAIIDDEEKITKLLTSLVNENCEQVEVIGTANTVLDGIKLVQKEKPDLVLLDIEMPHGSGFDLLEAVPDRFFDVIFITAYNQYAIKAFKVNAIDYVLKPVDIEELRSAIEKVRKHRNGHRAERTDYNALLASFKSHGSRLSLPTSDGNLVVDIDEIVLIEADGSYSVIYMVNGEKIMVSKNIKKLEIILEEKGLFRAHKSYIINFDHIKKYHSYKFGTEVEMSNKKIVPVSRNKKDAFLKMIDRHLE